MNDDQSFEFVDTNILVYAHDQSAGEKGKTARELIKKLWDSGKGNLSVQILQEFLVMVTRKITNPMSLDEAETIIKNLGFWRIHVPNVKDVLGAIDLQRDSHISFWDAMVIHSAKELGCSVLWSEDLNSGQDYEGVLIKNPFSH